MYISTSAGSGIKLLLNFKLLFPPEGLKYQMRFVSLLARLMALIDHSTGKRALKPAFDELSCMFAKILSNCPLHCQNTGVLMPTFFILNLSYMSQISINGSNF